MTENGVECAEHSTDAQHNPCAQVTSAGENRPAEQRQQDEREYAGCNSAGVHW